MTFYQAQTAVNLAGNYDIVLGRNKETVYVNLAVSTIPSNPTGAGVTILSNGQQPGYPVGYGNSQSYPMPQGTPWIRLAPGSSGTPNITFTIQTESIDIKAVAVSNVTATIGGGTLDQVTTNPGVQGGKTLDDLLAQLQSTLLAALAGYGGSKAPASSLINKSFSGNNYSWETAPPAGKRWRIWGALVCIQNTSGTSFTVSKVRLLVQSSQGTLTGFQYSKIGWELASLTDACSNGANVAVGFGPSVNAFESGTTYTHFVAAFPPELVLEPTMSLMAEFWFSASGSYQASFEIIPIGVEEPL